MGSVGTRAWIVLLMGKDGTDPLFLQFKEAQASVLEEFLQPSEYATHSERVVAGQHLMQTSQRHLPRLAARAKQPGRPTRETSTAGS